MRFGFKVAGWEDELARTEAGGHGLPLNRRPDRTRGSGEGRSLDRFARLPPPPCRLTAWRTEALTFII